MMVLPNKDLNKVSAGFGRQHIDIISYAASLSAVAISMVVGAILYRHALFDIVGYVYNNVPHNLWGSYEIVDRHLGVKNESE